MTRKPVICYCAERLHIVTSAYHGVHPRLQSIQTPLSLSEVSEDVLYIIYTLLIQQHCKINCKIKDK